ncbi:TMEM164 family acyltransferase [Lacrimispora sp. 210928-DFI.3.58]|uniref:TMEM164 family acyltransferase n=1 Tax=Lacrimispora sp. 210928-DFI.3.58 TaxID=2883214 RepID=UPI001D070644|nr:YwaF family protein [Lacrimispora sp. 210928-DFI.3.58]MCB7317215.1 YwaF family protein [Lacrimispora sp. 210928-DFI.3.58]
MAFFATAFFQATAWDMIPPRPYSAFHLCLTAAGTAAAALLAYRLSRSRRYAPDIHAPLFLCGLILAASEAYKQGFLYTVCGNGHYDWWYFPFQLCSIPMYLCLLLPLLKKRNMQKLLTVFYTFIQDFGLLGGIMALAEPSGLMHPYWTLTLHGFLWHFILIFIGLTCALTGNGKKGIRDFLDTIPLFLFCCAAATCINILSHPYGNADMFYISPYYPNGQVIFHQIALTIGILPGNLLYLLSVILGGAICHCAGYLMENSERRHENVK